MDKQSSIKMAQVLHDAQTALLSVTADRDDLATKVAMYERRAEATKVAHMMHEKGLELDTEFGDLVNHLEKQAEAGQLPVIAAAAEMIGPNMSFGSTHNDVEAGAGGGNDVFTSFLVGSVG
jgi:hypothetical protein